MPHDLQSDRELAARARTGDAAAWRAIYESTCDSLFAYLCWQVGDRDEARDLLQDVYLVAYRRLGAWRGEAPLGVWLRAIAFGRAIDWKRVILRRIKRTARLDEASAPAAPAAPETRLSGEHRELLRALGALSHHQRAALLLRECDQLSFREIAALLGCAENTARVHHTRACERMRRELGDAHDLRLDGGWEGQAS